MARVRSGYAVVSYRSGKVAEYFASITEAANHYKVGPEMIKMLIATGATLATDPQVTFDIPIEENVTIVLDDFGKPVAIKDVSFLCKQS